MSVVLVKIAKQYVWITSDSVDTQVRVPELKINFVYLTI